MDLVVVWWSLGGLVLGRLMDLHVWALFFENVYVIC